MKRILILLMLFTVSIQETSAQEDACKIVGELSLPILERTGLMSCMASVNPLVCQVSIAINTCSQDPACNGIVSTIIENGCVFTVEKTGDLIQIIGTSAQVNAHEMSRVYDSLNSIEGMHWLMMRLSQ